MSDQTVGNILQRHGLPPAPERKKTTTWREFIRSNWDILVATDFFTTEVWTRSGLVTYYILFFIQVGSRKVHIAGLTPNPNGAWMTDCPEFNDDGVGLPDPRSTCDPRP
ncbi:MAG: hypothetical protein WD032_06130 [Nitrospirales bacterium]